MFGSKEQIGLFTIECLVNKRIKPKTGSKELIGFFTTECSVGKNGSMILSPHHILEKSRLKVTYCSNE